jgi:hypothetical protein
VEVAVDVGAGVCEGVKVAALTTGGAGSGASADCVPQAERSRLISNTDKKSLFIVSPGKPLMLLPPRTLSSLRDFIISAFSVFSAVNFGSNRCRNRL